MDHAILNEAFGQARLKVNRAYRHFQEANGLFRLYIESDFYDIIEDRNAQTGEQVFRVVTKPMSPEIVLAIGDTFHNLSASLDYVMTGMMRAAGVSATRIGFPTDVSREALRKSFMPAKVGKKAPPNRRIVEAFPGFVLLVLLKIKPYRGGNFLLWEIRKADNIDKHNLIIPTVRVSSINGFSLFDEKYQNGMNNCSAHVTAGGQINILRYDNGPGANMKITDKGKPSASITFAEGTEIFLPGEPVFPTLLQCIQLVAEAINIIEREGTKRFIRM